MHETMLNMTGILVRYVGSNREALYELIGVVEIDNGKSVGVRYDNPSAAPYADKNGLVWAARWAWARIEDEDIRTLAQSEDLDDMFTVAAGGKLAVAQAEIARLEARLAELKEFVKVYNSL